VPKCDERSSSSDFLLDLELRALPNSLRSLLPLLVEKALLNNSRSLCAFLDFDPKGFESNSFLLFFRSFENALESRGLSFFLLDLTPNELLSISRFLLFALVLKALFKSDVAFFFLLFVCLNGLLGSSLFELLRSIEKESERYLVPPSEPHWLNSRIKEMDDSI
jgi:hypothetical protein